MLIPGDSADYSDGLLIAIATGQSLVPAPFFVWACRELFRRQPGRWLLTFHDGQVSGVVEVKPPRVITIADELLPPWQRRKPF